MLRDILIANKVKLTAAAEAASGDPTLVFDTIYRAAVKVRQRYKKIANKERLADLCISYMKAPKKAGKVPFRSFEDCIDRAMGVRLFPTRPVLCAAAVVLAAVIVILAVIPAKAPAVDVDGFVMEGSQSFANSLPDNGTYIKNLHNLPDLGGPDSLALSGKGYTGGGGHVHFDICTTSSGITYMAYAYANGYLAGRENAKAEVVLYRADTSGWVELARMPVGCFRSTAVVGDETGNHVDDQYIAGDIFLREADGELYLFSVGDESLRAHRYSEKKGLYEVDEVKLGDKKNYDDKPIEYFYNDDWCSAVSHYYNESSGCFDFMLSIRTTANYKNNHPCFLSFDPEKDAFTEPTHIWQKEYLGETAHCIASDSTGIYFLTTKMLDSKTDYTNGAGTVGYYNMGLYLHRYNGEAIEPMGLISDPEIGVGYPELFTVRDGEIHVVYFRSLRKQSNYVRIVDGTIAESYAIYPAQNYSSMHEYLAFFLREDGVYCMEIYEGNHLVYSKAVPNTRNKILAEIALPVSFLSKGYGYEHRTLGLGYGDTLNYIFRFDTELHFAQIMIK